MRRLNLRTLLPFAYEGNENYGRDCCNQPGNDEQGWMSMLRNEDEYLSSIPGSQEGKKCVPDDSSQSKREQEFSHWILHGARRKQEWQHGHGWR